MVTLGDWESNGGVPTVMDTCVRVRCREGDVKEKEKEVV